MIYLVYIYINIIYVSTKQADAGSGQIPQHITNDIMHDTSVLLIFIFILGSHLFRPNI